MAAKKKGSLAGAILLMVCAIGLGIGLSFRPWAGYFDQQAQSKQIKAQLVEAEQNQARLIQEQAASRSSVAKEQMLRQKGFKKPGEVGIQ